MQKLPRFRGHFFNWYGTQDLRVLDPAYVSSVDSGNLAGHLIALANACEEWRGGAHAPDLKTGWMDCCRLARAAAKALPAGTGRPGRPLAASLDEIEALLNGARPAAAIVA